MKRKKASNSSTNESEIHVPDESDNTKSDVSKDSDELRKFFFILLIILFISSFIKLFPYIESDQPFIITIEIEQTADSISTKSVEFANIYITCRFIE